MSRPILTGALLTIALAFPAAALCALVYRFPIPFSGYRSGPEAMPYAFGAVLFYGIIGGFPILAALGALAGAIAQAIAAKAKISAPGLLIPFSLLIAVAAVLFMATLDKLIGPW